MSGLVKTALVLSATLLLAHTVFAQDTRLGIGREATPEEITAWDIDTRPDGQGLPEGQGNVDDGEQLYIEQCAACHGDFAEGAGRFAALMGGFDTLSSDDPVKTIGSYWPYASTVWDYIHRAMPFGNAQSLSNDDTYAITAYLLYLNDIVDADFVANGQTLPAVEMPNEDGFFRKQEPEFSPGPPCMENCKDDVKIVGRAREIDVTPEDEQRAIE